LFLPLKRVKVNVFTNKKPPKHVIVDLVYPEDHRGFAHGIPDKFLEILKIFWNDPIQSV
jgi:hypothetical protein